MNSLLGNYYALLCSSISRFNVSHRETHFLYLSAFFRTVGQLAAWQYHDLLFVGKTDGGGLGRSIGYQTSLHSHGGAFCSVTCSQRKYHCPRIDIMASSPALDCSRRWCSSQAHPPTGSTHTERICLPYSVFEGFVSHRAHITSLFFFLSIFLLLILSVKN